MHKRVLVALFAVIYLATVTMAIKLKDGYRKKTKEDKCKDFERLKVEVKALTRQHHIHCYRMLKNILFSSVRAFFFFFLCTCVACFAGKQQLKTHALLAVQHR